MTRLEKLVDEMLYACGNYRGCTNCEFSKICDLLPLMPNQYSSRDEVIDKLNDQESDGE